MTKFIDAALRYPGRTTAIAIAILVLLLVFFLSLPIADFVGRFEQYDLVRAVLNRKAILFVAALVVVLGIVTWFIVRRKFRSLFVGAAIGLTLLLVGAVYEFQLRFPHAGVLSFERYGDSLRILLGTDAALSRFDPVPKLKLERRIVVRSAYPAIDVHFHLDSLPASIDADRLIQAMDAAGVDKIVNLDGASGSFERLAETFYTKYPDRIILFAKPDPGALQHEDGISKDLEWIKRAARMGARGLKENKSFGLGQRDAAGNIVSVDDVRLAPLWDLAGQLGMPLLIHTGEPPSFWDPVDVHNERYAELLSFPERSLHGSDTPGLQALMEQRERLLSRHPQTNFIGAHFGMNPNDLGYAAYLLDRYPNYYVDISAVVHELGREPYSARRFFIRYQDRILFGTDGGFGLSPEGDGWTPERMYSSHFEFLETDNEYVEYPMSDVSKQGTWRVYGLDLPDEVLEKIYYKNAERLIPTQASILKALDSLENPN